MAIGWDQRPHDIHDGSADPAGAVLRRREHNHLRLALPDCVRDTGLMQPGIWRLTRIDLAYVADVTGDEIAAARRWRPRHRRAGDLEGVDAQSCCLNRPATLLRQDLEAPGAGTIKGHLGDVDALHIG